MIGNMEELEYTNLVHTYCILFVGGAEGYGGDNGPSYGVWL